MFKGNLKYCFILLFALFCTLNAAAQVGGAESEKELIKKANKYFEKGKFVEARALFEQLTTTYPQNSTYNYKYGACLIFASEDKSLALKFLNYSINNGEQDPLAYFYLGRAQHLNYQFDKALGNYRKFQTKVKPKVAKKYNVSEFVEQCTVGKRLIKDIQQINVVNKKKMGGQEFFRAYRLGTMDRKILIAPDDFSTKLDKKKGDFSLIVHNPAIDTIYFSSYGEKGKNGKDIFRVIKFADNTYSKPDNIGPLVNTSSDEDFPYLHPNRRILYFASKGHNSIGGYDIFKSELDTVNNIWGKAVNMGFSINSPDDDILFVSDKDENVAYFSSSRDNKSGEMTVYKIIIQHDQIENTIVRGEVVNEMSNQRDAKITILDETNEQIGVFNSKAGSGAFTMTLGSNQTYKVKIKAPGVDELEVELKLPPKKEAGIVAKKFVLKKGTPPMLALEDNSKILEDQKLKEELLLASAKLNVNQAKDVEFNSKIKRRGGANKPKAEKAKDTVKVEQPEDVNLIADAEAQVKEVESEIKKTQKQADAGYFVANKKNLKSQYIKEEIEELKEEYKKSPTPDQKEAVKKKIEAKQEELKQNSKQAIASLEYAKDKEAQVKKKEKQKEAANAYLEAIKSSEKSGNSTKAIKELESKRDALEKIEKEVEAMETKSSDRKDSELATKKAEMESAEKTVKELESGIEEAIKEQQDLRAKAKKTKNKALKDEFETQANELDEEIKTDRLKLDVAKKQAKEKKSQYGVLNSEQGVIDEIEREANDQTFVATLSNDQKANISSETFEQEKVADQKVDLVEKTSGVAAANTAKDTTNGTKENKAVVAYEKEIQKAQLEQENLKTVREEKNLLISTLEGDMTPSERKEVSEKIEALNKQEKELVASAKKYIKKAKEAEEEIPVGQQAAIKEKQTNLASLETTIETAEKEIVKEEVKVKELEKKAVEKEAKQAELAKNESTTTAEESDSSDNTSEETTQESNAKTTNDINTGQEGKEQGADNTENEQEITKKAEEENKKVQEQIASAKKTHETNTSQKNEIEKGITEKLKTSPKVAKDPEVAEKEIAVRSTWEGINIKREEAEKEQDPKKKAQLMEEVVAMEKKAIEQQQTLSELIDKKVDDAVKAEELAAEQEKLAEEKKAQEVNATTVKTNTETKESASNETTKTTEETKAGSAIEVASTQGGRPEFDKKNPSQESLNYSNEKGYGIKRNPDYTYGPSPLVKKNKEAAEKLEQQAAERYYRAERLKERAAKSSDEKTKKKLNKKAKKLMKEGQKLQDQANDAFKEVNSSEFKYNVSEVKFALTNDEVENKDSAVKVLKRSKKMYEDAARLRSKAKAEKDPQKKADLINQAYALELKSIEEQNIILTGDIDVKEGEEEKQSEFVVKNTVSRDNKYSKKAASLRAQADTASNSGDKMELYELARLNELAANKKRTDRLEKELEKEKASYDNMKQIMDLARERSKNNKAANKAYSNELKADSLYKNAEQLMTEAKAADDEVVRLQRINKATEEIALAKEFENKAIAKYQDSKLGNEEEGVEVAFERKGEESVKSVDLAINNTQKPKENTAETTTTQTQENNSGTQEEELTEETGNESQETVDGTQETEEITVENTSSDTEESTTAQETTTTQEETSNTGGDTEESTSTNNIAEENTAETTQTQTTELVVNEIGRGNTEQKEMTSVELQKSYDDLLLEANEIEKKEAKRIEKIKELKTKSNAAKTKSEAALAQVDALTDVNEINKKLAEAEKHRQEAEKLEAEAHTQEQYMKNSLQEAKAKRAEAQLVIEGVDEAKKKEVLANTQGSDDAKKEIDQFLAEGGATNSGTENSTTETGTDNSETTVETNTTDNTTTTGVQETTVSESTDNTTENSTNENSETESAITSTVTTSGIDLTGATALGSGTAQDQIIKETFDLNKPGQYSASKPIPVDKALPKGLIYKVQVGAFRNKIDPKIFKGLNPLHGERTKTGIIRYTAGMFRGFKSANMAKGRIRKLGYKDAFVVVFYDGKRISLSDAEAILKQTDVNDKFVYDNLVQDEVDKLKANGITEEEANYEPEVTSVVVQNASALENGLDNDLTKISGLIYTVQIGVYSSPKTSAQLKGVTPLNTERTNSGYIRYTTGTYFKFKDADSRKVNVRQQGIPDAYVTAYNNGTRITAAKAKEMQGDQSSSSNDASATNSGSDSKQEGSSTETAGAVVFKVQVGAYRTPVSVETTPVLKDLQSEGVTYYTRGSLLIYTVGSLSTKAAADSLRQKVVNLGAKDAFVVAFRDGKRISMQEALK